MRIKIYDKDWVQLTTLFTQAEGDFNNLRYENVLSEVGKASFIMRLENEKCTDANLQHYNRIEICDNDDVVRWNGLIVQKGIKLNTVEVRCYSLLYLLQKRITGSAEAYNTQANTIITTLLSNTNGDEDTGITAGTINVTTNVQVTFERATVLDAIKRVAEAANAQFHINLDRELEFKTVVGSDLSLSVTFRYDIGLIENSNILNFDVDDNGAAIVTTTYGKSASLSSTEADGVGLPLFGLLEEFKNFRELDNQTSLDTVTANNNNGSEYSPDITLSPDVDDNFEVGDIVQVNLQNRLINIDNGYQILQKRVAFRGGQKQISVKIISNTTDFFKQINNLRDDVRLLGREV